MNALLSNPFKEALRKGEVQIGLWLSSTTSYMAEIAATSGYDWLLIDGEHAPNTVQDLYHQLQAIAPYASQPVIRPIEGSKALIKQVRLSSLPTAKPVNGRLRCLQVSAVNIRSLCLPKHWVNAARCCPMVFHHRASKYQ